METRYYYCHVMVDKWSNEFCVVVQTRMTFVINKIHDIVFAGP